MCECAKPVPVDAINDPSRANVSSGAALAEAPQAGKPLTHSTLNLTQETFPLDRYKPIRELGSGAGGSVYVCFDQHLSKYVSVKVLLHRSNANLVAFQKEAKVTALFKHPNVVSIIDFGITDGGAPFMVLEYVDGVTLDSIIREEDYVPQEIAVPLFIQIADALQHGHESKVFHRDIKSSNILVAKDAGLGETIRIIDFGVASLLGGEQEATAFQGRTVVGTPRYMPPDQALGKPYDARSEIYSFGCVMYETLLGQLPFDEDTAIDLLAKHAGEPAPLFTEIRDDLEISEGLEAIVLKCLEKDPKARFQNMSSLKEALQKVEGDLILAAEERRRIANDEEEEEAPLTVSTGKWMMIAALVALVSLIPVAVMMFFPPETKLTKQEAERKAANQEKKYTVKERIVLPEAETSFKDREKKFDFLHIPGGMYQAKALNLVNDEDLAELKGRKELTAVNVHRCEIDGSGLQYISDLPLQALDLNGTQINDAALDEVAKMKKLRYLHMEACLISDGALKKIQHLPLVHLGLSKTEIGNEGLRNVSKIKTLEVLEIAQTRDIDAQGLRYLASMPNLQQVFVGVFKRQPEEYYRELGKLKRCTIIIQGLNIPLRSLAHLDVRGLSFAGVRISRAHVDVLRQMKNLKMAEFWNSQIGDDLMTEVSTLPLTELSLWQEAITDEGLQNLSKMKTLRTLLIRCQRVSPAGLAKLKKSMPDLSIDTNPVESLYKYAR